jgi:glutaminyl-tRNA synthetase
MPTISALRRRGCTPEALWKFNEEVGVTRINSVIDVGRLENAMRDDLGKRAQRRMAVLKPLKVVLENYPQGQVEEFEASNHPEDATVGTRKIQFSRELYIDADDFMLDPPKKFFRLGPGREVRLKVAGYFITCKEVVKNPAGEVTQLTCTVDLATKGGEAPDGRKVKGTIHWVSAAHAVNAEVRLFDRLFVAENPDAEGKDYKDLLNPNSLVVLPNAKLEAGLASSKAGDSYQFERVGYFCADLDSKPGALVFNRTVTLKDAWAKVVAKGEGG